ACGPGSACTTMSMGIRMIMDIRIITDTIMGVCITSTTGMSRLGTVPDGIPPGVIAGDPAIHLGRWTRGSSARVTPGNWTNLVPVAAALLLATLLAPASQANGQASNETLHAENEYRECLYSKSRNGRYKHDDRESDFGLLGECRNSWVTYMDMCVKAG